MERRASGRLADEAAAVVDVAASTQRAAATVKGGVRKGSSSKRQRSASPTAAPTASNSNDVATKSHNSNNDAAVAATDEMPWGSSWWDKMPAEIRIMIMDHNSPLLKFLKLLNGQFGTKRQLEKDAIKTRATAVSIWVDAFKRDWKGNLYLLPDTPLKVEEGLCEVRSRSMYERLCRRFPDNKRLMLDNPQRPSNLNTYVYNGDMSFDSFSLLNIPARHGWFDLLDFEYPITLGWFAIEYGHTALLRHLAFTLKVVDLSRFERLRRMHAMDFAAGNGSLEIVQMLHDAGNNHCTAYAMDCAAFGGRLEVMQWLHANRREGCTERASYHAARNGHLHVVEWLVKHYPSTVGKADVIQAAVHGHVDIIAFLFPRFPNLDVHDAIEKAAFFGHLEVVKWFHTHRPDAFTPLVFWQAVERNHAHIVQFLIDNRHVFDVYAIWMVKDPAIRKSMVDSLTLERARTLLEDAKTKETGFKMIAKSLEAAVKRLEKAQAKANKEANTKKRKTSSK